MENAISKGDINEITKYLDEQSLQAFNIYNDKMDLLLGSYYRYENNKTLKNEEQIVQQAKTDLEDNLNKIKIKKVNKCL